MIIIMIMIIIFIIIIIIIIFTYNEEIGRKDWLLIAFHNNCWTHILADQSRSTFLISLFDQTPCYPRWPYIRCSVKYYFIENTK